MNVGGDYFQIHFGGPNRVFGLDFADHGEIVESDVALAAHAVEEIKGGGQSWVEVLPRELEDRDVMAELDARTLAVAQHQREGCLEDGFVRGLMGGFLVNA